MSDKPALLAHPGLGGLAGLFAQHYTIVRWPEASGTDVEAAVVIGAEGLPKGAIEALPKLKLIACFGAGYDGVDADACRARGVAITNCPGANAADVADVAIGLLISAVRGIAYGDRMVRAGDWKGLPAIPPPKALGGMKLGVVGLGAIGLAAAKRAAAFEMDVRWTGPRAKPEAPFAYEPDLMTLATWADALILALRPDAGTERMINADVIDALGSDGVLVNVARGSVVDEDALIAALKAGRLGAAGLDVFEQEPTPASRWADVPNVTLTPHLAGATRNSVMAMAQTVMANLAAHFSGAPLLTRVL